MNMRDRQQRECTSGSERGHLVAAVGQQPQYDQILIVAELP
jgi:hypothetical protein